ncbi:hypothetical protein ACFV4N_32070 [Actinosynnema sp. NPDC059797]
MKLCSRVAAIAAAVVATVALSAPSSSAAVEANPYTPEEACQNDFGGTWSRATDGHRDVRTPSGAKWGDVWLMYSSGANCVATIKSVDVGVSTWTEAWLMVEGAPAWKVDDGAFQYYAAVKAGANRLCVMYAGDIYRTASATGTVATGARYEWGNCG